MTDFQRILLMKALSGVGTGLISVFIPIYLLQHGYSFGAVVLWLFVHHLSLLANVFLVAYVAQYIGFVRCWYIRIPLLFVLFGGLSLAVTNIYVTFFLALISGASEAFFWIPYNIFLVRTTNKERMGASLALLSNATTIASMFVPIISAVTIVLTGYDTLFVLALVFVGMALIPVRTLRNHVASFDFSLATVTHAYRLHRAFFIPEAVTSITKDGAIIWSLFIFVTALNILDIGILGTLAAALGMVITFVLGRLSDATYRARTLRWGTMFSIGAWLFSYLVGTYISTPILLYVATVLQGIAVSVLSIAYGSYVYNRARNDDAHLIVLREVPTVLGRLVLFFAALVALSIGNLATVFLFVAGSLGYFLFNNLKALE